jgi:hypothetical protein
VRVCQVILQRLTPLLYSRFVDDPDFPAAGCPIDVVIDPVASQIMVKLLSLRLARKVADFTHESVLPAGQIQQCRPTNFDGRVRAPIDVTAALIGIVAGPRIKTGGRARAMSEASPSIMVPRESLRA